MRRDHACSGRPQAACLPLLALLCWPLHGAARERPAAAVPGPAATPVIAGGQAATAPPAPPDRQAPAGELLRFDADTEGALAASVFSLPSAFFTAEEAVAFLASVRALDPDRELLVLTDLSLSAPLGSPGIHVLATPGRSYSPWPRDPFSLVRGEGGRVVVLLRPNLQAGREADAGLGLELAGKVPPRLDKAWGGVRWRRATVPFHNGQVLLAPDAAWVSLHTLEPRILQILGIDRVPVESFATAQGIDRYLAAANRARDELAALYGRPVRFVHALPASGPEKERAERMRELGGGAGYDLDSLLTLLPAKPAEPAREPIRALVADLAAGRDLLKRLSASDWGFLRQGYDLGPAPERLPALLAAAQEIPRARSLARYLDQAAEHLRGEGMKIERLPLLLVPVSLLREQGSLQGEFLLGWNNVVVEVKDGLVRAEGFSSLLPAGDAEARAAFTRAGCRLDLVPPLVESVVRNGGYRCASNHLRISTSTPRPPPAAPPAVPRKL